MDSRRATLQFVVARLILGSLGIFATRAQLDARTIVFYVACLGQLRWVSIVSFSGISARFRSRISFWRSARESLNKESDISPIATTGLVGSPFRIIRIWKTGRRYNE